MFEDVVMRLPNACGALHPHSDRAVAVVALIALKLHDFLG